jgi:hypothetical protein
MIKLYQADEITLTYESMEGIAFGSFTLQFVSWFTIQMEVPWPASMF